jgi:precorrin-2 dehydrogenase/sirohydrochlorin ferrochelatase
MAYFPINVDIRHRPCIVIGGGRVALRKAKGLLDCAGTVTVISPEVLDDLQTLADTGKLTLIKRGYQPGDLENAFLVIAATDDEQVQEAVHTEADQHNILLNVADVPKWCNFILPATVRRGDLAISISTHGQSPALAKRLRRELEQQFGTEYDLVLQLMGRLRPIVLAMNLGHEKNKIIFEQILHPNMITWLKNNQWQAITSHLQAELPNADLSFLQQLQPDES